MIIDRQDDGDLPKFDILGWTIQTPAPQGTFLARIVDIDSKEDFQRKKYESEQMETIPAVRILVGLKDGDSLYLVQSNVLKASGSPKSNFYKMIRDIRGEFPPTFDVNELRGVPVSVTVQQQTSMKGTVYGKITNIGPVPGGTDSACPSTEDFNALMIEAGADIGKIPEKPADPLNAPEPPAPSNPQPKPESEGKSEDVPF